MKAIVDSGASISIVNKSLLDENELFVGDEYEVYDVRNRSFKQKQWTKVFLEVGPFKEETRCLVMQNVSFEFLISRPLMKKIKMNLHFDDIITFGSSIRPAREQVNILRSKEDRLQS